MISNHEYISAKNETELDEKLAPLLAAGYRVVERGVRKRRPYARLQTCWACHEPVPCGHRVMNCEICAGNIVNVERAAAR